MNDYSRVLSHFRRLRPAGQPHTWHACCPAHDDNNPSLRLWVASSGCLCAKCYAGCPFDAVVEASRTDPRDWFPEGSRRERTTGRRARAMTPIEATYDYTDAAGRLLFQVVRYQKDSAGNKHFSQRRPDGAGGWVWNTSGVERPLYRLPELLARPEQPVIVVEGEKDVESLRALGLVATCNPGGSGQWHLEHGKELRGRRVAVIPDNDRPGQLHAAWVCGTLLYWGAASVRLVQLGGPEGSDVTDWLADGLPGLRQADRRGALLAAVRGAPEWSMPAGRAAGEARAA